MSRPTIPQSRLSRVRQAGAGNNKLSPEAQRFAHTVRAEHRDDAAGVSGDKALPTWMTRPGVIFTGIIVGALIVGEIKAGFITRSNAQAKQAAQTEKCVVIRSAAGEGNADRWLSESAFMAQSKGVRVAAANNAATCTPDSCAGQQLDIHTNQLGSYLNARLHSLQEGHRKAGLSGVEAAQQYFTTSSDDAIVFGARDMLKAGKIDQSRLGDAEAHYLKLLMKHYPEPVPLCFRPKASAGAG